MDHILKKGKF